MVVDAPGFFNKLIGHYKRWIAIFILLVSCFALIVVALNFRGEVIAARNEANSPMSRRYVYGDPVLLDELSQTQYKTVFPHQADRYLACYAQPAVESNFDQSLSAPSARHRIIGRALANLVEAGFLPPIEISESDPREVKELKRIVIGMRDELKTYLGNGIGTTESYAKRLEERQTAELTIYRRIKRELSRSSDLAEWEKGNAQLRAIGAPTIPRSEEN